MALLAGLAFLIFWLLFSVFTVTIDHAALATGIIFIIIGILVGAAPAETRNRWHL